MAKHCDNCKMEYPENLASCPLCGRAPQAPRVPAGSESEIELDMTSLGGAIPGMGSGSESAVDLGHRGRATHHAPPIGSESDIEIAMPPARVPDTNSGVFLDKVEGEGNSSVVEWASLVQDVTQPADGSGLRVDSPSDKDLIAKAKAEGAPDGGVAAGPGGQSAMETSGVRVLPGSEADVEVTGDSASGIGTQPPRPPAPETSGVRTLTTSEADVVISGSASQIEIPPPVGGAAEESSAINLGELHKPKTPSDLNLASDALDSAASGVDLDKVAGVRGDSSVEPVVHLAEDAGASSVSLADGSGSGSGSEQSGLDLTMLSGGASGTSSILPERQQRPQSASDKPRRKAPPTQAAFYEHFSHDDDDSAVNLGAPPERPAEEESVPASGGAAEQSAAQVASEPRHELAAAPEAGEDYAERFAPKSDKFGTPRQRSLSKALVGAALGLVIGAGSTAGLMLAFGGDSSKSKTQLPVSTNPAQVAAADLGGKDWAARFGDQGPDDIAKLIDELKQGKKDAEQQAAGHVEAIAAADKKAARLTEDAKTAATKAANLAAAVEKVRQAELAAQKKAEENALEARDLKNKAADAEAGRRTAVAETEKVRDDLKSAAAKQAAAAKQLEETATARKQAEAALEAAAKKLKDGKYLKDDAAATDVARAVDQVIAAAKSVDPSGKLAIVQAELAAAQSKLARSEEALSQRRTPQAMLDVWLALLQQPAEPEMAKLAMADADRVARDTKTSPAVQAKAACVRGLALRQQGHKDEGRAVLTEALKNAPAGSEWQAIARAALDDKPNQVVATPTPDPGEGNPLLTEASYIAGVQQYWAGSYARAEERFLDAVRHDNRDARYYYYLGLSRRSQDKRSAAQRDFERAADLERQGRPARAAVNAALERIQGNLRQEVDQFRR